jgi:hypothetical protein
MKKLILFLAIFIVGVDSYAQSFFTPGAWKRYRKEIQFSFGASNCLTDLGGRDAIGTNFLRDWEKSQIKVSGRLAYGYYLNQSWVYRSSFNFGIIGGNDNLTQEPFRNNRNLNFRSVVFEFSQNIQWLFVREKLGNKYGLKNIKGRKIGAKSRSIGWYLTAGVGVFYYNPMGKRADGSYVVLRDLHTEGQGLPGGPEQYKKVSIDIPVGIGARKAFSRQWGIYMEFTQHYTFTDYLDDVSTVYYSNEELLANYGTVSAEMADPSLGNFVDANGVSYATKAGEQRGDPKDKDNFMFLTLGGFYKIHSSTGSRGKRKKIKALF